MSLTLMYITNNVDIALTAQKAGVDRIWVDMEYIGKEKRQGGLNTVKSHHTVDDVKKLRPHVTKSELMVRINPIHDATDAYCSTEEEIEQVIAAGADVIMLPMFKTSQDVEFFVKCVAGRAKTVLLFETAESVENVDSILEVDGIEEVHIGLNDLHLAHKKDFMFELICDGTVKKLCEKFRDKGVKYGFGGIARVGYGMLPAEHIIAEHYNMGSTAAILSRGFCDASNVPNLAELEGLFTEGIRNIRLKEKEVSEYSEEQFAQNLDVIKEKVSEIVAKKNQKPGEPAKKICMVTTVSLTMKSFVVEMAKYLHERAGYDITLICDNDDDFAKSLPEYLRYIPVKMARGIDFSALSSIKQLTEIFKREKFDLVQYATPNASFYASIASRLANVPIRLYCQWGIRYVGLSGLSRKIFKFLEKIVCMNSTYVKSQSFKNRQFAIDEKLCKAEKISVIGIGGTIGVDLKEYDIEKKSDYRNEIREKLGLSPDDFVFGFIGRLNRDKGVNELISAFKNIPDAKLLLVGSVGGNDTPEEDNLKFAKECENVIMTGHVPQSDVCKYIASFDVLVHPTYREGFGKVIQEGLGMAVPVITTDIPGPSEVIENDVSGKLVPAKDSVALHDEMVALKNDEQRRIKYSQNGHKRAVRFFERSVMLNNILEDYKKIFTK